MAVWQFQVELLPMAVAEAHGILPEMFLTKTQRLAGNWWNGQILSRDALENLEGIFLPGRTWTDDLQVFGNLETSCVSIMHDGGSISEVHIRLDLRSLTRQTLLAAQEFCQLAAVLLITENNKVVEPTWQKLVEEIRCSPSYRFVKDPLSFLSGVSRP